MKAALLIVDIQKSFMIPRFKDSLMQACAYINEVSTYFRDAGMPVVHIQDLSGGEGPGSDGFKVADEVLQAETDIYITKKHKNAFYETDLENVLKELDVDFVVVSGFAVPWCVLSTYLGAEERGFNVSFLQHGVAGEHQQDIERMQYQRDVINYKALHYLLQLLKKEHS